MAKFYIHDTTRGAVGNSMVWWRRGHFGYTTNLDEAHQFEAEDLPRYLEADDLVAYPVEHVDQIAVRQVDVQTIDTRTGIRG